MAPPTRTRIGFAALFVVALAAGADATSAQLPQRPRDATTAAQPAAALIGGAVVAADTGRPVRFARITLVDTESRASRATTTDAQGRFTIPALAAGQYTLTASKAGMLDVSFGQQRPGSGRPGTPIQLRDKQRLDDLTLKMPRGGVITGTVVDEVGDPFFGVSVRAMRYVTRSGVRTLTVAGTGSTDDRGVYRIAALMPGDYVVTAAASASDELKRIDEMKMHLEASVLALRQMESALAVDREKAILVEEKAARDKMLSVTMAEEPAEAYVPAFYPGASPAASTTSVPLDISEERGGVDLQLLRQPVARISGVVTIAEGSLPRSTQLRLVDANNPFPYLNPQTTRASADGKFSFAPVPPGQYTIVASASVATGSGATAETATATIQFLLSQDSAAAREKGMAELARQTGAATPFWALAEVSISGQPVTGVTLNLQRGMSISGTVNVENPNAPVDLRRLSLTVVNANPLASIDMPTPPATVDPQGRFTIRGVMPGSYRVVPSVGVAGLTIKSSVFEGRDSLDFPLVVKPGQDVTAGVVTMTSRPSELAGTLQDSSGAPASGYTIVAFASDRRFWGPGSRRVQGVRPATNGQFNFRGLPAGEYRLVAVTDVEPGQWFDPAFVETLVPASMILTLSDGERRVQDIRIR